MKLDKKSEIFMNLHGALGKLLYYIPINDTTFELSGHLI